MSFHASRLVSTNLKKEHICSFLCPAGHVQLGIVYTIRVFQTFAYVSKSIFLAIFQIRRRTRTGSACQIVFIKSMHVFLG